MPQLVKMHLVGLLLELILMISWSLECFAIRIAERSSSALVISPSEYL